MSPRSPLALSGLLLLAAAALLGAAPPPEWSKGGMVAADHALASAAGAQVLAAGGNAVDAVVAAALAAGVVQPAGSGLGGGGFALVSPANGQPTAFDFREVAPAAAHRDLFVKAPSKDASTRGGLAVAVPQEGPGLAELHRRHGALPFAAVVAPAQRLAAKGFPVGAHLANSLDRPDALELARGLFDRSARPERGEQVRRSRLAAALQSLARTRGESFRTGPVAQDIVAAVQATGGILTAEDLRSATVKDRTVLTGSYRGWTIHTFPPPSSGGIILLQALSALESSDLASLGHNSAASIHLITEVMKHGYADRATYLGDPDRVAVPTARLLSPERRDEIRSKISMEKTFGRDHYGPPAQVPNDAGTQHISVLDAQGLAVALTTTINTSFGSAVISPEYGILLNNEMDDFVARPGVPNAFGLIGSESNAVAAGARPLSSMSPTVLISPDGQRIVVGASGGPFIISSTLQTILAIIDYGLDPSEAVAAPRFHHQWQPDTLMLDEGFSRDTQEKLRAYGHTLKEFPHFSAVQVIHGGPKGTLAASDPRKGGWPAGSP